MSTSFDVPFTSISHVRIKVYKPYKTPRIKKRKKAISDSSVSSKVRVDGLCQESGH
jgi:hypothetical protein